MRSETLIQAILRADKVQIDQVLDAAMQRKRELYPNWKLFYFAAEKGSTHGPEEMIRNAMIAGQNKRGKME